MSTSEKTGFRFTGIPGKFCGRLPHQRASQQARNKLAWFRKANIWQIDANLKLPVFYSWILAAYYNMSQNVGSCYLPSCPSDIRVQQNWWKWEITLLKLRCFPMCYFSIFQIESAIEQNNASLVNFSWVRFGSLWNMKWNIQLQSIISERHMYRIKPLGHYAYLNVQQPRLFPEHWATQMEGTIFARFCNPCSFLYVYAL